MPNFKLTYFNVRGRAETSRMLFALVGQDYVDERIPFEDWPKVKQTTPFGSLPLLEVDGVVLCQSHAIEKYLGKLFNLAGDTPLEEAQVDMVRGCQQDIQQALFTAISGKTDQDKADAIKTYTETSLNVNLKNLENILSKNDGIHMVGNKVTIADIHMVSTTRFQEDMGVIIDWELVPKIKALVGRIEAEPKIADWIEKRPKSSK